MKLERRAQCRPSPAGGAQHVGGDGQTLRSLDLGEAGGRGAHGRHADPREVSVVIQGERIRGGNLSSRDTRGQRAATGQEVQTQGGTNLRTLLLHGGAAESVVIVVFGHVRQEVSQLLLPLEGPDSSERHAIVWNTEERRYRI